MAYVGAMQVQNPQCYMTLGSMAMTIYYGSPVFKIVICNYQVASGDCLVALIANLAIVGGVQLVGNGRLVKGMNAVGYTGTRPNPQCMFT